MQAVLILAGVSVVAAALLAAFGYLLRWQHLPSCPADAALVFGTGTEWKARSRWMTAARLFKEGVVQHIIVSGGVSVPAEGITEAAWFREKLVEEGVPADRIVLEDRATHTGENAAFALPLIQQRGFRSVVLVMSDFEGIRAHLTAKKAWWGQPVQIYNCHAASPGHWSPWTWWLTREGRRWTWYTVPRLFRYRLLPYLWLRTATVDVSLAPPP